MERAYKEEELVDGVVIDSEGYIYGKVDGINVEEDKVVFLVYESKPDSKELPDIEALKDDLAERVKTSFTDRMRGVSQRELLEKRIREELDLNSDEALKNEHIVSYGERVGVKASIKKAEVERREVKGEVELGEISAIMVSVINTRDEEKTLKVVFLNQPREAMYRRIPLQETVPFKNSESLRDKLVLDAQGVALGFVDSVVFSPSGVSMRVCAYRPMDYVRLRGLYDYFDDAGRTAFAELIKGYFKGDEARRDELEDFIYRMARGSSLPIPPDLIYQRYVKEMTMDVPWKGIHKIGDVVVLKLPLPELKEKGYLLG